ncbi:MAG TPA: bifunctional 4-hydroxy-2-oxoglutarate aldolase/2-dehydro-3-deoxy-phosphogluconate aldolase [Allocoleopsis sp.]
MNNQTWLKILEQNRIIAVIRSDDINMGYQMAKSVALGGIKLIEITFNSEQPTNLIDKLSQDLPNCIIGAGTILSMTQLKEAIACNSQFIFSPHLDLNLIKIAQKNNVQIIPGTLTPTEIITALQGGVSCVKVFPIQAVGGATYIKYIKAPLGNIPIIPTGGVTLNNASELILAGAIAVGLGGDLFPQELIRTESWEKITLRANTLVEQLSIIKV